MRERICQLWTWRGVVMKWANRNASFVAVQPFHDDCIQDVGDLCVDDCGGQFPFLSEATPFVII